MLTPIATYSPAEVDTQFMRAASAALRWGQGRFHTDMATITLAGRLLR